jgi:hypothetical protein
LRLEHPNTATHTQQHSSAHSQDVHRNYSGFVFLPSPSHLLNATAFKDASERQITDHSIHGATRNVNFTIKYRFPTAGFVTATLPGITVQEIDEPLVLKYWTEAGGCAITGLGKDHVFKILEETKRYWAVQWIGYSAEEEVTIVLNF